MRQNLEIKLPLKITIADYFKDLKDKRVERTKKHKLIDIVTIAICAVICGADSWVLIEAYGKIKQEWLKQFLELTNGIPSHDTFARVFAIQRFRLLCNTVFSLPLSYHRFQLVGCTS
jgi:hypothetical protein